MRIIVYLASVYNLRKYYYGYNYALARVLMNAIGSGQYRADASLQEQNLITHVRGITFGLQTTALNGNCRVPKLAIAIGPLFRLRTGILDNCARSRVTVRGPADASWIAVMVTQRYIRTVARSSFHCLSIKLFRYRPPIPPSRRAPVALPD